MAAGGTILVFAFGAVVFTTAAALFFFFAAASMSSSSLSESLPLSSLSVPPAAAWPNEPRAAAAFALLDVGGDCAFPLLDFVLAVDFAPASSAFNASASFFFLALLSAFALLLATAIF